MPQTFYHPSFFFFFLDEKLYFTKQATHPNGSPKETGQLGIVNKQDIKKNDITRLKKKKCIQEHRACLASLQPCSGTSFK